MEKKSEKNGVNKDMARKYEEPRLSLIPGMIS